MGRCDIRGSRGVAAVTACVLLSVLCVAASAADETPVRFEGRVMWIAGGTLMVTTDDGLSINVDLTHVSQDAYQRLASYDRVVVTGIIPRAQNRVVATSIESLEP
jgi:hypothetical protein